MTPQDLCKIKGHIVAEGPNRNLYDFQVNWKSGLQNMDICSFPRFLTRVSDPDPQDPHVFGLPGSGSGQKGKKMNE